MDFDQDAADIDLDGSEGEQLTGAQRGQREDSDRDRGCRADMIGNGAVYVGIVVDREDFSTWLVP
jgi:hypothetical protein